VCGSEGSFEKDDGWHLPLQRRLLGTGWPCGLRIRHTIDCFNSVGEGCRHVSRPPPVSLYI
jgi:hypothetical protein